MEMVCGWSTELSEPENLISFLLTYEALYNL